MEKTDDVRFCEIMAAVSELYEMKLSEIVMGIWFTALSDYSIDEVASAVSDYIGNPDIGQYKPKPADIIKMISGTTSDQAYIAWTKVDKAVRTIGSYKSVVFDDPLIHRVITDMGGWIGFGDITEKEWVFTGKEFMQRYRGFSAKKEIPGYPSKMIGVSEGENRRFGYAVEDPIFIGEKEKGLLVLTGGNEIKRLGHE